MLFPLVTGHQEPLNRTPLFLHANFKNALFVDRGLDLNEEYFKIYMNLIRFKTRF